MIKENHYLEIEMTGVVIGDELRFSLAELCQETSVHAEWVCDLVDEGILDPKGESPEEWRFPLESCYKVSRVIRLQRDLGLNLAGVALVLDLLEEVETLRLRLSQDSE